MLAKWCEILPLFVIQWLTKRSCETVVPDSHELHPNALKSDKKVGNIQIMEL